ncbi:hypothetical protein C8R43DRAFT_943295 [Mycena crocata]|nr:hypothetical protein C8R43DRAFT_943295 [Mycena crocata]
MDRKICMPEVLHIIFSHLGSVVDSKKASADVAAVARTCKTFLDPALDILWSFQDGLVPALRCLPGDSWDCSGEAKDDNTFIKFRRPLRATDWERPRIYWSRIRNLYVSDSPPISSDVYQMLLLCCPNPTLFPNLQRISCCEQDNIIPNLIFPLLSPQILSISLVPGGSIADQSLLPLLGVKCPDLEDLNFRADSRCHFKPAVLRSIFLSLSEIRHLESLVIPNIDSTILEHIARLPSLKSLHESQPYFQALEDLALYSTIPQAAIALLSGAPSRPLTDLNIIFEKAFPDARTVAQLYSTIATHCSEATLECLCLDDSFLDSKNEDMPSFRELQRYMVNSATLRLLFPFHNLTTITLRPYFGFDLDDVTLTDMAEAWPQVEELTLTFSMDQHLSPIRTHVSLMGIHAIATHCAHLRKLDLFFDASEIPVPRLDVPTQTSLVELDVQCSPISASAPVATFLTGLFPNLRRVGSDCAWTAVNHQSSSAITRWENVHVRIVGESTYRKLRDEDSTDDEDPSEESDDGTSSGSSVDDST